MASDLKRPWSGRHPLPILVAIVLGWGAFAFGSNYWWAYVPLMAAVTVIGAGWLLVGHQPVPRPVVVSVGFIALAVGLQLIALPRAVITSVSPATDVLLRRYDLAYAAVARPHSLSIDPWRTVLGFAFLVSFSLFLFGLTRCLNASAARRVVRVIAVLGALLAIAGIVQHATFNGRIYGFWQTPIDASPFGPFVNKNHFAGWMLMGLPVTLGYLIGLIVSGAQEVKRSWRDRLLWSASSEANRVFLIAFSALLMGIALVLSLSRSGVVCFALEAVLCSWIAWKNSTGLRRSLATIVAVVFLVLAVSWVGADAIVDRFSRRDAADLGGRLTMWKDTGAIAKDFWVAGTGLNTYGVATLFYQERFTRAHLREAHNDYLQLASEGGLLLGFPLLLTAGAFVREVIRRFRRDNRDTTYWIRAGAVIGLCGVGTQSLVDFSLQMPGNAVLFVTLCALAVHR